MIDNGTHTLKAGFAGSEIPSVVVSAVASLLSPHGVRREDIAGEPMGMEQFKTYLHLPSSHPLFTQGILAKAWKDLYLKLGADPERHPLVLTQPLSASTHLRSKLFHVLFNELKVPAIHLASTATLSAYAAGAYTCLIVDVGAQATRVVPVLYGRLQAHYLQQAAALSGRVQTTLLSTYLSAEKHKLPSLIQPQAKISLARRVKEELGYCRQLTCKQQQEEEGEGEEQEQQGREKRKDILEKQTYIGELANYGVVQLCLQEELYKVGEVLFNPSELLNMSEMKGLPALVQDVIEACPMELRRSLCNNIVLTGGVTMMKGLPERLYTELKETMGKLGTNLGIKAYPNRRYTAWEGGALLQAIPAFDNW